MNSYKVHFEGIGDLSKEDIRALILSAVPKLQEKDLQKLDIETGSKGIRVGYLMCQNKVNADLISSKVNNMNYKNHDIKTKVSQNTIDFGTSIIFTQPANIQSSFVPQISTPASKSQSNVTNRPPLISPMTAKTNVPKPVLPPRSINATPVSKPIYGTPSNNSQIKPPQLAKPKKDSDYSDSGVDVDPIAGDNREPAPLNYDYGNDSKKSKHRHSRHHKSHRRHRHQSYSSESSPSSYSSSSSSDSNSGSRRHKHRRHKSSHRHSRGSKQYDDDQN